MNGWQDSMEREMDYGRLTKNAESMRAEEGIDNARDIMLWISRDFMLPLTPASWL